MLPPDGAENSLDIFFDLARFFAGIEYDYYGIGEFWGCKSLFNDFGMQFRFFAYQRASLTGGVAIKAGQSVLSIMTVNTSDNQEFPKLR